MALSEAAKEAKRAYNKEWAKKNPEKVQAIQNRYWEKRLSKLKAAQNINAKET